MKQFVWKHNKNWCSSMCGSAVTTTEMSIAARSPDEARETLLDYLRDKEYDVELIEFVKNEFPSVSQIIPVIKSFVKRDYDMPIILGLSMGD